MMKLSTYFIGEVIEINLSDLLHHGDHRALTSGKTHLVAVFFATQLQSRDVHPQGLFIWKVRSESYLPPRRRDQMKRYWVPNPETAFEPCFYDAEDGHWGKILALNWLFISPYSLHRPFSPCTRTHPIFNCGSPPLPLCVYSFHWYRQDPICWWW